MRPMTKVLNPVVRRVAGRRFFPMAADLHHTGRRSGRAFVTPVGARHKDGIILIPLTFGNRSDWVLNVLAAGRSTIRIQGTTYEATQPSLTPPVDVAYLIRALFPVTRLSFKLLGIKQFMRLRTG